MFTTRTKPGGQNTCNSSFLITPAHATDTTAPHKIPFFFPFLGIFNIFKFWYVQPRPRRLHLFLQHT